MLQRIVGEPQPNVVGDILRRASGSFNVVDAIVASRISREVLAFVCDVELAVLVDLKIGQNWSRVSIGKYCILLALSQMYLCKDYFEMLRQI